jgi:hypothetical protein
MTRANACDAQRVTRRARRLVRDVTQSRTFAETSARRLQLRLDALYLLHAELTDAESKRRARLDIVDTTRALELLRARDRHSVAAHQMTRRAVRRVAHTQHESVS